MILSIVLTVILGSMTVCAFIFFSGRFLGWILSALYAFAILVVWWPDFTTMLAHLLGIGRGVDLVLILVSVVIMNAILFIVRHMYHMHQQITKLARHIALREVLKAPSATSPD